MTRARSRAGTTRCATPEDRRLNRIAGPSALVIFGVTGDLSRKKLMPAVYDLANRGLLPPGFALVGFARRDWEDQDFAQVVHDAVKQYARTEFREDVVAAARCRASASSQGEFDDDAAFDRLRETVERARRRARHDGQPRVLPVDPAEVLPAGRRAAASARASPTQRRRPTWRRVVIEKPFGHDLQSARELNDVVRSVFPPDCVFRIDHYLGKETVQNILALRFANELYEPIWNAQLRRPRADHDGRGHRRRRPRRLLRRHRRRARRHPEPPAAAPRAHRDGGADLVRRRRPARREGEGARGGHACPKDLARSTARGQYAGGWQGGEKVLGFLEEDGHEPGVARPRPTPRSRSRSTPAAGPACRSTCAPASASAAASPRSPSCSSARPQHLFAEQPDLGARARTPS